MSQTPRPAAGALSGPTVLYRDGPTTRGTPPRCRVAFSQAGSQFQVELERLLHQRLRLVTLIILPAAVLLFLKGLIDSDLFGLLGQPAVWMQGVIALTDAALAAYLWSRTDLHFCTLRKLELALFGLLTGFFAWWQWEVFYDPTFYDAARPGQEYHVVTLMGVATSLRWVFLLIIYGVFIPNTWRRCAALVGGVALLPQVITPLAAWAGGHFTVVAENALFYLFVLVGTAAVMAVFGSYRLEVLQQKAFEAQQLGQYRLKKRLGAGGMGEVFLAEHMLLRRPCALKLIRPEQAGDPTSLQRFEREVRAMATLTHWNTVEVFDYGHADDGTFYYVMEYLPGQNLESLVARHGPLPPGRAVHFLRQVCRALREAHGVGLLHRDIKPSNVIACERGGVYDVAKLLDFGLVQDTGLKADADKLTVQGTILGSPPYMSPEQAAGKPVDARSDIYSVGGVAYFLLTGRPPFQKETPLEMLLAHAYETPEHPDGVPDDLRAVVLRCLAKSPADRYPDADSLEKALAACACAGDWTEEQAAAWWRQRAAGEDGRALDTVPTQVTATV